MASGHFFKQIVNAPGFQENGTSLSSKYLGINATAADSLKLGGVAASGYSPLSHNHSAAEITTGTLVVARGGTGATSVSSGAVFIGPTTGAAAAPSFRALVASDIPTLNQNTTGTAGGLSGTPNITVAAVTANSITTSGDISAASFKINGTGLEDRLRHVTSSFILGNQDWTPLVYSVEGFFSPSCTYDAANRGVSISGSAKIKIRVRMPIDPDSSYYCRLKTKKISGDGNIEVAAISLDNNFAEINTDTATLYNSFAVNDLVLSGTQYSEGKISGYNTTGTGDHQKFDPEAKYFDLFMWVNGGGSVGGVTVVERLELWRVPNVLVTDTPTSTTAAFRLPHGTAPASPVNGDIWTTTGGLYTRINGSTKTVSFSDHTHAYEPAFTTLSIAKGGTGQTTATAAFDALSPTTNIGEIAVRGASASQSITANTTTTRKFLRQTGTGSAGAVPVWDTLVAGDIPDISATYATAGHNHNSTYLGISATAADSSKLGGVLPSGYALSGHTHSYEPAFTTLSVAKGGTGVTTVSSGVVFAGPGSGAAAAPSFRALVAADIPSLDAGKITTGTIGVARGGTGAATFTTYGVLYGNGTSAIAATPSGTAAQILLGGTTNPTWQAAPTAAKQVLTATNTTALAWTTLDLTYLPDSWVKKSVKVATTANILSLSGVQTIDGVVLNAGDRILVKNQTTTSQNGIYEVSGTTWARVAGANTAAELAGATVSVDQGTANAGKIFSTTFKTTDTVGTTACTWYEVLTSQSATMAGKFTTVVTTAGGAGLNLPHGTAPTSPTNGDVWTTTSGLYARINGSTKTVSFSDHNHNASYLSLSGGTLTGALLNTAGGYGSKTAEKTYYEFGASINGTLSWGTGDTFADTVLYRSAAGVLKTDGTLEAQAFKTKSPIIVTQYVNSQFDSNAGVKFIGLDVPLTTDNTTMLTNGGLSGIGTGGYFAAPWSGKYTFKFNMMFGVVSTGQQMEVAIEIRNSDGSAILRRLSGGLSFSAALNDVIIPANITIFLNQGERLYSYVYSNNIYAIRGLMSTTPIYMRSWLQIIAE